jgi:hypothetical protein
MNWIRPASVVFLFLAVGLTGCSKSVGPSCGDGGGGNICSGQCVDVSTDPNNCGTCGKTCEPGAVCSGGTCACPVGEMSCGGACVDIKSDVNNCGGCGMSCGGTGSTCTGGACEQVIATQQATPVALALSSAGVFWINQGTGDVLASGLTGGTVTTLAQSQSSPTSICADSQNVYWNVSGAIMTVPAAGGTPSTFFSEPAGSPTRLAIDSNHLYWTDVNAHAVVSMPLSGGGASTLANGLSNPYAIAAQGGNVYWSELISAPTKKGEVMRWTPNGGGTYTLIASTGSSDEILGLAVDANNVYWVSSLGNVVEASNNGAGTPSILVSNQISPSGITVDATNVYWTTGSVGGGGGAQPDGTISTMPIAGGTPSTIAPGQINPSQVAVNATSVYWITNVVGGSVMRLSPK